VTGTDRTQVELHIHYDNQEPRWDFWLVLDEEGVRRICDRGLLGTDQMEQTNAEDVHALTAAQLDAAARRQGEVHVPRVPLAVGDGVWLFSEPEAKWLAGAVAAVTVQLRGGGGEEGAVPREEQEQNLEVAYYPNAYSGAGGGGTGAGAGVAAGNPVSVVDTISKIAVVDADGGDADHDGAPASSSGGAVVVAPARGGAAAAAAAAGAGGGGGGGGGGLISPTAAGAVGAGGEGECCRMLMRCHPRVPIVCVRRHPQPHALNLVNLGNTCYMNAVIQVRRGGGEG
jgi:hypothetical protein